MSLYVGNKKYCAVKKIGVNNTDILITSNGTYTPDEEYSGYGVVRVNIPEPIYNELAITPSTTTQMHTPLNDGFSSVTVNPVTSSIDSNIIASNIKKGINILGVTGTFEFTTETLTITPTTSTQTKTPTKDGYSKVTINPVTAAIDSEITAGNIKTGVTILGVTGTVIEVNNTTRDITANGTFSPPSPYTGFSEVTVNVHVTPEPLTVTPSLQEQTFHTTDADSYFNPITVNAVTAAVDSNIKASNILKGVTILGVAGSIEFETKTVTPTTSKQVLTPTKNGFSQVTVNAVTAAVDSNIKAENIKKGAVILGITGTAKSEPDLQNKTVTDSGTYTCDSGYDGLGTVTVDLSWIENELKQLNDNLDTIDVNANLQVLDVSTTGVYTPDSGYDGFSQVIIRSDGNVTNPFASQMFGTYISPTIGTVPEIIGYRYVNGMQFYDRTEYPDFYTWLLALEASGLKDTFGVCSDSNPINWKPYDFIIDKVNEKFRVPIFPKSLLLQDTSNMDYDYRFKLLSSTDITQAGYIMGVNMCLIIASLDTTNTGTATFQITNGYNNIFTKTDWTVSQTNSGQIIIPFCGNLNTYGDNTNITASGLTDCVGTLDIWNAQLFNGPLPFGYWYYVGSN